MDKFEKTMIDNAEREIQKMIADSVMKNVMAIERHIDELTFRNLSDKTLSKFMQLLNEEMTRRNKTNIGDLYYGNKN